MAFDDRIKDLPSYFTNARMLSAICTTMLENLRNFIPFHIDMESTVGFEWFSTSNCTIGCMLVCGDDSPTRLLTLKACFSSATCVEDTSKYTSEE
jgi:hypothetical protein